ncbi:MAG: helix-turn-helix domain-containing protein [Oscillospiraceae bacterium]
MSDGQRITAHSVYAYVFDYDTFNGSRIAGGEASEKDRIATSLIANRGNVSKTAAEFGIARDTLYRKMKKYGITANRGVS